MKKTALFTLMIASVSAGAVFYYFTDQQEMPQNQELSVKAASQQDTELDTASVQDTMAYLVSGTVELSIEEIQKNVADYNEERGVSIVDEQLFEKYLSYKYALQDIDNYENTSGISLESLQAMHQAILDLQSEFFTEEEILILFEHENRMRDLALQKLMLKQQGLDDQEYQSRLESELASQPEYVQASYHNQVLLTKLSNSDSLDEQGKYLSRSELVGEEGAERLEALDQQRNDFNSTLEGYFQEQNAILSDSSLTETEQQNLIAQLRTETFEPNQQKRVQALERIRASQ
ncbi:lipase chaperone [Vibrio sp. T187]|uniref:lipase secretion chaperone n=1 Tax=Vibrio TaxID=662 RepID=UPI0010C9645F|nr:MULTISPECIES: lipase secretion chaperone [Vibrio]MBW3695453.1 lipase chaperone [Vibrio sp. T187]